MPPTYPEPDAVTSPAASPNSPSALFSIGQPAANGVAHGHAALANGPSPKLGTKVAAGRRAAARAAAGNAQGTSRRLTGWSGCSSQQCSNRYLLLIPKICARLLQCLCFERIHGMQDRNGWDIMRALAMIKSEYKHDPVTIKAVVAIEKRVRLVRANASATIAVVSLDTILAGMQQPPHCRQVGRDYFRIHPKGVGMMCVRSALPPLSFVSEYLGEMYSPAQWCDPSTEHIPQNVLERCRTAAQYAEVHPDAGLRCKTSFAKPRRMNCQTSTTRAAEG